MAQLPPASAPNGLPRFGVAVGVSSLGAEVQAATAVTRRSNVRFGFSDFSYSTTFNKDGVSYDGSLSLRSAEVLYDQYIAGPVHISPGVMVYDGNKASGTASVSAQQSFTLGGTTYFSQSGNPIGGEGTIGARTVAPMVVLGFGNLLPRSARHFSVNFDIGVVFQGSPKAAIRLTGGACSGVNTGCVDASSNPAVQANVLSEQTKVNNSLTAFQYYPVISLTFGYKF